MSVHVAVKQVRVEPSKSVTDSVVRVTHQRIYFCNFYTIQYLPFLFPFTLLSEIRQKCNTFCAQAFAQKIIQKHILLLILKKGRGITHIYIY